MSMPLGQLRPDEPPARSHEKLRHDKDREDGMVIRQTEKDGSIRYIVTDALLRRAAKAASRKNFEAA